MNDLNSRRMSVLCMLSMLYSAMVMTAPATMLPELSARLSVGVSASGSLFTCSFLGYTAFALPAGALADRLGKKRLMVLSLSSLAVLSTLVPLAGCFAILDVAIFFCGGFNGMLQVMVNSLQADMHRDRPTYWINIKAVFFGAGAVLMPLASGLFSGTAAGVPELFFGLAVLALLLCAGALLIRGLSCSAMRTGLTLTDVKKLAGNVRLWLVCASLFIYDGCEVSTWGWMSTFLKEKLCYTISLSGLAVAIFWTAMTFGRFVSGRLTSRFRVPALIVVLGVSSFIAVLLCAFVSSPALYWFIIVYTGLSFSGIMPLLLAYGAERGLPPSSRTAAYAVLMALGNLGVAVIPLATGFVFVHVSLHAAMAGPSMLFLVIIGLVLYVDRRDHRYLR